MPSFRLVRVEGGEVAQPAPERPFVVGRAENSDLTILHPTVSRRHAEVEARPDGLWVHDLASSNGTRINDRPIGRARAVSGDVVTFGEVAFRVEGEAPSDSATPPGVTVHDLQHSDAGLLELVEEVRRRHDPVREARKLRRLLEASKALAGKTELDALLDSIATLALEGLGVDRASILLRDASGALTSRAARSNTREAAALGTVPRSIAERAVRERVALRTEDAQVDARFAGQSVVAQKVRSALCAPLLGDDEALGVLYVDRLASSTALDAEDLDFLVAFAGIAGAALAQHNLSAELRREAVIRSNFERYFAPDLVDAIANPSTPVQLGGERRPVAVFFSDIRGFTSLAERMAPDRVAALLTEYFTEMVDIVFEHRGTLDKFVGDAVMAIWGAPLPLPDAAERALAAARAMQRALLDLNARWRAEGRETLGVGMGLAFGEVFAGNIGSERRLEYTVIGDPVNLAARLCDRARAGEILVSGELRSALGAPVSLAALEPMTVKGKAEPVAVFRVV